VNSEERLSSNYNSIYYNHPSTHEKKAWSFPRLMQFLGEYNIGLSSGCIVGSGTIGSGCIAEFMAKLDPVTGKEIEPAEYSWLKDGDVVKFEVEKIGTLQNTIKVLKDTKILDTSMVR
jgi:2-keto-4-pentenoate hydratase/2-oxohepta-3-ene-1,7-dioic acid hydratase in catechol pathway